MPHGRSRLKYKKITILYLVSPVQCVDDYVFYLMNELIIEAESINEYDVELNVK